MSLRTAAAPVAPVEGAGNMTLPDYADNRDVGQPGEPGLAAGGLAPGIRVGNQSYMNTADAQAAAAAQNSPDAVRARQIAAYTAAGKPMEAQQLDTAGVQGQAAKLQLEEGHQKMLDRKFDKRLAAIQTPQQLAEALSGSDLVGGGKLSIIPHPDGKKFQLGRVGDDGTITPMGSDLSTDPKELQKQVAQFSQSMDYSQKVTFLQHQDTLDESKRHNTATEGQATAQLTETTRHNKADEGNASSRLGLARKELDLKQQTLDESLKNDPMRNLPGAVKLRATTLEKQITNLETALNKAATEPGYDPNSAGSSELRQRKAKLEGQRNDILKPYLGDAGGKSDYMGYDTNPGVHPKTEAGMKSLKGPPGSIVLAPQAAQPTPSMAATQGTAQGAVQGTTAPGAGSGADPLLTALGGASGNQSIDNVVAQSAPVYRQAAETLRAAQEEVKQAALAGNQAAVGQAMAKADAANKAMDAALKDMMPAQAQRVRQALGV
jgi:hypothetical protein